MLFNHPIAVSCSCDYSCFHHAKAHDVQYIEVQLPEKPFDPGQFRDMINTGRLRPVAFRMPPSAGLGTGAFNPEDWEKWLHLLHQSTDEKGRRLICSGRKVPLGIIFEYLDRHPTDFSALQDFKDQYVKTIASQLEEIQKLCRPLGFELYLENAPMGGEHYFEPGRADLYPALRTPRHLLEIAENTGVRLCFDTANACITSNVLTYMHRSRSLFAGATEQEITHRTNNWVDFYQQIQKHVGLVRLSYAHSWGDTKTTHHIPFPPSAYGELIQFAELIREQTPVILPGEHLEEMIQTLHQLKKS
ncbi:hypothetical protein [Thermoactinomyces vulgaris]|jgi:hypothetical protein|uniref:hypothetical protein n=1 Tax=Thermoactinomyces vulgaris TaxID=2026 RepID=UPI0011075E2B|nr:hypothetical protein [Thermoactinomyces vulgaris]QCV55073.1 hypothetical protein FA954_05270 [Thermoactinomyces vulgaris]